MCEWGKLRWPLVQVIFSGIAALYMTISVCQSVGMCVMGCIKLDAHRIFCIHTSYMMHMIRCVNMYKYKISYNDMIRTIFMDYEA